MALLKSLLLSHHLRNIVNMLSSDRKGVPFYNEIDIKVTLIMILLITYQSWVYMFFDTHCKMIVTQIHLVLCDPS